MVKDIIVVYRKNETILILISLKRYFSHLEKTILNLSLRHCNSRPLPLPRTVGLVCVCVGCGGQSRRYNHPKIYNDPATVSSKCVGVGWWGWGSGYKCISLLQRVNKSEKVNATLFCVSIS